MQPNERQPEKQTTRLVKPTKHKHPELRRPSRRRRRRENPYQDFLRGIARLGSGTSDIAKNTSTQHEARPILNHYQQAASNIPEVKQVRYNQRKNSIHFVVHVDRISQELSHRLSEIESQLYDVYIDWFFEFEHLSSPTLPRQYDEYSDLSAVNDNAHI